MKAELLEHDNVFRLVLEPETTQENLRLVRLGMSTIKGGASLFVSVGKEQARGDAVFKIKRNANPYFCK